MRASRQAQAVSTRDGAGEGFVRTAAFEYLSRAGFAARALVYGIVGVLAFKLAVGDGGRLTNQQGALTTVAHQPFGQFLLTLVAIGLAGYSIWRLLRATLAHGPEGADSTFDRLAALGSGIAYAGLCALAVEILIGSTSSSSDPKHATGGVLGWPGGTWIVGAAGVGMIGIALYQGYRGISRDFLGDSKTEEMRPAVRKWITAAGVTGHLARMVVFGLVGVFLVKAAVDYDPKAAVGIDGALAKIVHASYGGLALGIVSAGLIAFSLYSLSDARYRRI